MIALKITQQKAFMAELLTKNSFDTFLLEEAVIETFNTFTIDGRIKKEFYAGDSSFDDIPSKEYSTWSSVRGICLDLIKGKRTPVGFKFILHSDEAVKQKILEASDCGISPDQVSFGINIKYSAGQVIITTGISASVFMLDKSAEKAWDEYIPSFLDSINMQFEVL